MSKYVFLAGLRDMIDKQELLLKCAIARTNRLAQQRKHHLTDSVACVHLAAQPSI